MNLSDRIQTAEKALVLKKDQLDNLIKQLDTTPNDDSLLTQVDATSAEVEVAQKSIDSLKRAEMAMAHKAAAVNAPAVVHSSKAKVDPADVYTRVATIKTMAFMNRMSEEEATEKYYPEQSEVFKGVLGIVNKSTVAPATSFTAGWAQELMGQAAQAGILQPLINNSVLAALSTRATTLNFEGRSSIVVPRRNSDAAAQKEPAWVGEGGAIPVTGFSFGSATINRYKVAAIVPMTRELVNYSPYQVEAIIRQALDERRAQVLDDAFLSNAAMAAGIRPAGLLNGVTAGTGTAGGGQAAVIADIKALVSAMLAANTGARPVLLLNNVNRLSISMMTSPLGETIYRDELSAGRLLGIDVISSANVPANTAILVDAANLVLAIDSPEFDVSEQASIVMANADGTAPTMAGAGGTLAGGGALGTAGQVPRTGGIHTAGSTGASTTGYVAQSLWQTWQVGVRMVQPVSWGVLRPGSVFATSTLTW